MSLHNFHIFGQKPLINNGIKIPLTNTFIDLTDYEFSIVSLNIAQEAIRFKENYSLTLTTKENGFRESFGTVTIVNTLQDVRDLIKVLNNQLKKSSFHFIKFKLTKGVVHLENSSDTLPDIYFNEALKRLFNFGNDIFQRVNIPKLDSFFCNLESNLVKSNYFSVQSDKTFHIALLRNEPDFHYVHNNTNVYFAISSDDLNEIEIKLTHPEINFEIQGNISVHLHFKLRN